ncbi:hypothetical protein LBMAG47_18430 [Planctomycetia bacterium]|nr:hypothetical protein LBMAG47_18430 [Planctomycetia bacterium]
MKRKKAGRNKRKTPALPAKPLVLPDENGQRIPPLWSDTGDYPRFRPADGIPCWTNGTKIRGIAVPPDIEKAIAANGEQTYLWVVEMIVSEPWRFFDHFPSESYNRFTPCGDDLGDPEYWKWDQLDFSYAELMVLHAAINTAMAQGFFLAMWRYADDLKQSAEAAPVIEGLREAARKGGAARRAQAAPIHKAIRKRFRELRKTTPKKTVRYMRVGEEFQISERHVARIVDGID